MKLSALWVAAAMLVSTGSAMANCYEGLGCDDSEYFTTPAVQQGTCQQLWEVRNLIYQQNGYCFQTDRAKASFSNDGCFVTSQAAVKLNVYERKNIATIVAVEKAKGCR